MSVSPATPIVIVGLMGSGKSTVGLRVAERLGRRWADSDALIEAETGSSISEIFNLKGEPHFRLLEADVILSLTILEEPVVLSLGGGAVVSMPTRLALAETYTVWLSISPEEALSRMSPEGIRRRPLLADDPLGALKRLSAERDPFYNEVADDEIRVDGRDSEEIVEEFLSLIGAAFR